LRQDETIVAEQPPSSFVEQEATLAGGALQEDEKQETPSVSLQEEAPIETSEEEEVQRDTVVIELEEKEDLKGATILDSPEESKKQPFRKNQEQSPFSQKKKKKRKGRKNR
jgi:hypothetical protein